MSLNNLSDFLAMGGYPFYVWGSYGFTLAVMVAELAALRRRTRAAVRDVRYLRCVIKGARA
jgi:heme exporter protein D